MLFFLVLRLRIDIGGGAGARKEVQEKREILVKKPHVRLVITTFLLHVPDFQELRANPRIPVVLNSDGHLFESLGGTIRFSTR